MKYASRFLTLSLVLVSSQLFCLSAQGKASIPKLDFQNRTWLYANAQPADKTQEGYLALSWSSTDAALQVQGGPSIDSIKNIGRVTFSPEGSMSESSLGTDSLSITKVDKRYNTTFSTQDSTQTKAASAQFTADKAVFDIRSILYAPGICQLFKLNDETSFRLLVPEKDKISDYEAWAKIVAAETLSLPAGTYQAWHIEMGLSGLAGLATPRFHFWIDSQTRMLLKIQTGKSITHLVALR